MPGDWTAGTVFNVYLPVKVLIAIEAKLQDFYLLYTCCEE